MPTELPIKIEPNPLVTSIVELRFVPTMQDELIFGKIFPIFSEEFPTPKSHKPTEFGPRSNGQFLPFYSLSNDFFRLNFAKDLISFEPIAEYPYWKTFYKLIEEVLPKFLGLQVHGSFLRLATRYTSILPFAKSLDEALQLLPKFPMAGFQEKILIYSTEVKKDNYTFNIQIAHEATSNKLNAINGPMVDIDVSIDLVPKETSELLQAIDDLHLQQKQLFFGLLKPDYLTRLNPTYPE